MNNIELLPDAFKQMKDFRINEVADLYQFIGMFTQREQKALIQNLRAVAWTKGFVPQFHNMMLNTGIGKSALDMIVDKIIDGGVSIIGADEVEILRDKIGREYFNAKVHDATRKSLEFGGALSRLVFTDDEIEIVILQLGTYRIKESFRGQITEVDIFLRIAGETEDSQGYVLVERRFFKVVNGIKAPYIRYSISKLNLDTVTQKASSTELTNELLTDEIRALFPDIDFEKDNSIPLSNSLGVEQLNPTITNSNFSDVFFGDALLMGAQDMLMAIEHGFTSKENDKYIGSGRLILPAHFQVTKLSEWLASENSGIDPADITKIHDVVGGHSASVKMGSKYYAMAPGLDPENQKPISLQFDLRVDDHAKDMDLSVRILARFLRVNPSDLDSAMNNDNSINQSDITTSTIQIKRMMLTLPLKNMLRDIAEFYGITVDDLDITWSRLTKTKIADIIQLVNAGLISRKQAKKMIFPNKTKQQLNDMISDIEDEGSRIPE